MIALGPEVLEECFLPQMVAYIQKTKEKLKKAKEEQLAAAVSLNRKNVGFYENQKQKIILNLMWGTLLAAGRSLLTYYTKNWKTILRKDNVKYAANNLSSKIKNENCAEFQENPESYDKEETRTGKMGDSIVSSDRINLLKVYEYLYDQFGSSLNMINADWSLIARSKKSRIKEKNHTMRSSYKRIAGNFHHKLAKNPFNTVGRMRVRTLGKFEPQTSENDNNFGSSLMLSSNFVKKEADESSSSSIPMEFKYYGEDKGINQPRPTSSTSSDADFNYLAGCGLPTDIFEPASIVSSESTLQHLHTSNIKQETKYISKQNAEEASCVVISSSVVQNFEVVATSEKSFTTVSRHPEIDFAFGTSQWSKGKLRRKRFTMNVGHRYNGAMNIKGIKPKTIVGNRMGTPRGITSDFVTIERSCSLITVI